MKRSSLAACLLGLLLLPMAAFAEWTPWHPLSAPNAGLSFRYYVSGFESNHALNRVTWQLSSNYACDLRVKFAIDVNTGYSVATEEHEEVVPAGGQGNASGSFRVGYSIQSITIKERDCIKR